MGTKLVSELEDAGVPRHTALKAAMAAQSVRAYDVALMVGVSEGQLSKLLTGKKPLTEALAIAIRTAIEELAA